MYALRLYHDQHWDFEQDDAGDYTLQTPDGPKSYKRVPVEAKGGFTDLALPEDYDPTPLHLMHLTQSLTDRNAPLDSIKSVSGEPGAKDIVKRLAAFLEAKVIAHPKDTA